MAYHDIDGLSTGTHEAKSAQVIHLDGSDTAQLPDATFVRDAVITREGVDLHLEGPNGHVMVEGYFAAEHAPNLVAPDGTALTPSLVNSFAHSGHDYAQGATQNDESPVGAVQELKGEATVTHVDGTSEPIAIGTAIYQGDVIETEAGGAVNVHFIDDTSFAVSSDSRLAIDEFVFDPSTQSGEQNFSVLKGMFVFTSGLIGRDDPDDVKIETPNGSIGIRGTIIAGNVDTGETTLIEGAIVVRDLAGNEVTLADQFETAKIVAGQGVQNLGQLSAQDVVDRFTTIATVAPTLFSSLNDAAAEQGAQDNPALDAPQGEDAPADGEQAAPEDAPADANGSVDQNNDSQVDGTVNAPAEGASETVAPAVEGGLGTDPMGLQTLGTAAPASAAAGVSVATMGVTSPTSVAPAVAIAPPPVAPAGAAPVAGSAAVAPTAAQPLVPPPTTADPGTNPNSGGGTITAPPPANVGPIHIMSNANGYTIDGKYFTADQIRAESNLAPEALGFFSLIETQQSISPGYSVWAYDFGDEFVDPDNVGDPANDHLTYSLSAATISYLETTFGANNVAWGFEQTTGRLEFLTIPVTVGNTSFAVEITATDDNGASVSHTYNFNIYDGPLPTMATITTNNVLYGDASVNTDNSVFIGPSGVVTGNKIFTGNGNDSVTINEGSGNYIFLGQASTFNTVTITSAAANVNNVIIGGQDNDIYEARNAHNKFFGMDGDDVININLSETGLLAALNTMGANDIMFDAGTSGFNQGSSAGLLAAIPGYEHGDSGGFGDTLALIGSGPGLDFRNIDDHYFRGIERIDATAGGTDAVITLGYQDILEMTDHKNTLILRVNAGDTLSFVGSGDTDADGIANEFEGMVKVGSDVSIEDNGPGPSELFDIYTDGTVTLLVEVSAATVNGLPS
jgi:hypothetical protein